MSSAKSSEEAGIPAMKEAQAKGHPDKTQPSVASTMPEGMKAPKAEGEHGMGGVHKGNDGHIGNAGMGAAVAHLNRETERGAHAATVAGEKMHGHSGHHKG